MMLFSGVSQPRHSIKEHYECKHNLRVRSYRVALSAWRLIVALTVLRQDSIPESGESGIRTHGAAENRTIA